MPAKVVVVGSTNVDLIAFTPAMPRPGETVRRRRACCWAWGDNSVSSRSSIAAETKVLMALVRARFVRHLPYLVRGHGVLVGVRRGQPGTPWASAAARAAGRHCYLN
jgi:hypothetical protein